MDLNVPIKITKKDKCRNFINFLPPRLKNCDVSTKNTRKLTWTSQTLEVIDIYCGTNDITIYWLERGGNSLLSWDSMFFLNTINQLST